MSEVATAVAGLCREWPWVVAGKLGVVVGGWVGEWVGCNEVVKRGGEFW